MIGKIVVGLLAVVCFSGILTEAQVLSSCFFYHPRASFANISGFAYVVEYSKSSVPCLTLDITPQLNLYEAKLYGATYNYNDKGSLRSITSSLAETGLQPGQAQSTGGTNTVVGITTVVGYVGDSSGFLGYALVSCGLVGGSREVAILVKSLPPDSAVVAQLKEQLNAEVPNNLQNISFSGIPHASSCVYAQH